eukprot:7377783-Prymnesium_polylepis.1
MAPESRRFRSELAHSLSTNIRTPDEPGAAPPKARKSGVWAGPQRDQLRLPPPPLRMVKSIALNSVAISAGPWLLVHVA